MNVNPMQLIQMIKGGKNPQQLLMSILQQQGQNNPIIQNATNLARNGNVAGLEALAKNLAEQRGLNYEEQINNLRKMFN